ncbi:MAG: DNA (cytosine-5-)-methyltransferase, partial [Candidatus Dojkabacteria bacterium]
MNEIRFIELFGGIGGFRAGLESLGCRSVGYYEIDKYAVRTYNANWDGWHRPTDIRKIKAEEIPDHEILTAGFPCQPFSVAGQRKGFADTRGTLFFEIARILEEKRPPYIFLENVRGLISHDKGRTLNTILNTLNELGYYVDYRVLNSRDFGVPQNRERIYIIGINVKCLKEFVEDGQSKKTIIFEEIIKPHLLEILLNIYSGVKKPHEIELKDLELDSVILKEMVKSGLTQKLPYLKTILKELIPNYQNYSLIEPRAASDVREDLWEFREKDHIGLIPMMDTDRDIPQPEEYMNTESLLKKCWEGNSKNPKEFITSMVKNVITEKKIYSSVEIEVITNLFIVVWKDVLCDWWKETSSNLTKKRENTNVENMWYVMGTGKEREKAIFIGHLRGLPRPQVFPFIGDAGKIQENIEGEIGSEKGCLAIDLQRPDPKNNDFDRMGVKDDGTSYTLTTNGSNHQVILQYRRTYFRENKTGDCPTLTANMGTGGHNVPMVRVIGNISPTGHHSGKIIDKDGISHTLRAEMHGHQPTIEDGDLLRKLTPREC